MREGLQVAVLVDFDNVFRGDLHTEIDAEDALFQLGSQLGPRIKRLFPGLIDASVRLYGAWEWADGTKMRVRAHLAKACSEAPTKRFGFPLTFELADSWTSPRAAVNSYMQDTVCRCRMKNAAKEQKLVDTMMVGDLIHFATFPGSSVVVVTDDHDVIPGFAEAAYLRTSLVDVTKVGDLVWLRPSQLVGKADRMLAGVARITDYASLMGD